MTSPSANLAEFEFSNLGRLIKEPVVSVLMLAYNHDRYLAEAIDGVLNQQTDFPIELLIGEDCSTDATREIALRYQRLHPEKIRVLTYSKNVGMNRNLERLIEVSRGDFIAFCEGDDYWLHGDKLQSQVDFLRQRPDCGLVHGNYLHLIRIAGAWRARVAFRKQRQLQHRSGDLYMAMLQGNRIQTCTVICRRKLALGYWRSGLGVGSYMVGDWPLSLYVAHESNIGFIERPLAAYRRTPGSVTNSGHVAAVERELDAIRMVEEFCDFFDDPDDVRHVALAAQYRVLLWLAFRAGDRQRFDQARCWLAAGAPAMLRSMRVRLMRATIGFPPVRIAGLEVLAMLETIKHRIEFKKRDGEIGG